MRLQRAGPAHVRPRERGPALAVAGLQPVERGRCLPEVARQHGGAAVGLRMGHAVARVHPFQPVALERQAREHRRRGGRRVDGRERVVVEPGSVSSSVATAPPARSAASSTTHGAARLRERDRGRQAVRAGADDDRVVGHRPGRLARMSLSPLAPEPARLAHELLAAVRPRERARRGPAVRVREHGRHRGRARGARGQHPPARRRGRPRSAARAARDRRRRADRDRHAARRGLRPAAAQRGAAGAAHRRGLAEDPVAVLLSRRFDIPWEAAAVPVAGAAGADLHRRGAGRRRTCPRRSRSWCSTTLRRPPRSPTCAPAACARSACEGGPTLLGALVAAGLVDELFLTIAPLLTGGRRASRRSSPAAGSRSLSRMRAAVDAPLGSELLLRYGL